MRIEPNRDAALAESFEVRIGWPRAPGEVARRFETYPDGHFVARDQAGAAMGVASVFLHRPDVAFVGGMVVDPAARNRGVGRALLDHAISFARERGARVVGLEATAMGRPLYESVGFRALGATTLWERTRAPEVIGPSDASIYPISACEIMELHAFDSARFGANRSAWLASTMARFPERSFVAFDRRNGKIVGHAMGAERWIGPVVADSPDAARKLLLACERAGAPPRVIAPEGAAATLRQAGYEPTPVATTRMALGGALPEDLRVIYGIASWSVG